MSTTQWRFAFLFFMLLTVIHPFAEGQASFFTTDPIQPGEIKLNEIKVSQPYNRYKPGDARKQFLEFYNASLRKVDLKNLYISTDENNLGQRRLGGVWFTEIKPGKYKTYHVNYPLYSFRLISMRETSGLTFYLSDFQNGEYVLLDSISLPPLEGNQSYGNHTDRGRKIFENCTPRHPNIEQEDSALFHQKRIEFGVGPLFNSVDGKSDVENGSNPRFGFGWYVKQSRYLGPVFWNITFHYLRRGYTIDFEETETTDKGTLFRTAKGFQRYKVWSFGTELGVNITQRLSFFVGQNMLINVQDFQKYEQYLEFTPVSGTPFSSTEDFEIRKDANVQFSANFALKQQLTDRWVVTLNYFLDQRKNVANTGKVRNHTFMLSTGIDIGYGWRRYPKASLWKK